MHFVLFEILHVLFHKLVLEPVWNYGKQLVQAAATLYLFMVFIAFYVSQPQPRPLAAHGVGSPVAP